MPQHDPQTVAENWRAYLTRGETGAPSPLDRFLPPAAMRRLFQRLPSDPRCVSCRQPFRGPAGWLMGAFGRKPSRLNPKVCNACDDYVSSNLGGTEVELTMLFADVRGSTALAERMNPAEYGRVINRFFRVAGDVLVQADALIEKLIGDQVAAMFVPGFAGAGHADRAVDAAQSILRATGHADPDGPWIPLGVGVHTGTAYVGAVGNEQGINDIVMLGDDVNIAARLSSLAAAGEVLVSADALQESGLEAGDAERRSVELKGKSEKLEVGVIRLARA